MATCEQLALPALPLSPEQQAVLASPSRGLDKRAAWVELTELDEPRLQRAITKVLAAHSVLRHTFRQAEGCWQQYWPADVPLPELQHAHALDGDVWCAQLAAVPMDPAQGPMIQLVLVSTAAGAPRLVVAASELVADHDSLRALIGQIAAAYGGAPALECFQYHQYIEWREALLESEDAALGRRYWSRYLQAVSTASPPRLCTRGPRVGTGRLTVSRALETTRVLAAAQHLGLSSEVLLQSLWWLLLARLTGFTQYLGGWRHDCRCDYDLMHGAVGVFEKVLPMIVDATAHETLAAWLVRSAATARAHMDAQEYWAVASPPLAAHLAVGFGCGEGTLASGWRVHELTAVAGGFELFLQALLQPEGGCVVLHADAALYSPQALACLLEQFVTLLDSALVNPAARLDQLSMISPSERQALRSNATPVDFGALSVAEHIARWACATPQAPAIEADGQTISYAQLLERADRLAHWLCSQGATRGDLIALSLPRSADWLVSMLAIWRLGAAYLPLEPEWPAARRAAVIADAAPALVVHGQRSAFIAGMDCAQLALSELRDSVAAPAVVPTLQDVAYVLYTSGSTGKPKGAVITHGALLNYIAAVSAALELGRARRWALTSSVAADLGNTALFGALFNGGCLVIGGAQHTRDAVAFARFMREQRIDGVKMVPSHLEALLECDQPCLPQRLVLGGEAASATLVQRIQALAPQCALYNHYGPTETTVGVMVHAASASDTGGVLPLTQVLANNRVLVLDDALQLAPSGALGQLYVGGAQLCRGYLHDAAPSSLVEDPWHPGERLYRTGDLAYVRPEGGLQLAGRVDHQVKIRGFRIEPAEIEAALLVCTGVRQAAVIPVVREREAELAAFLVLEAAEVQSQVAAELALRLPSYMLPARYVVLAEFPRLSNGKIDRLALSQQLARVSEPSSRIAPRTPLETSLADCMAELLGRAQVGIDEDFFALGGQSLLAIKLAARIGRSLHMEVEPGLVLECPTVAQLAQRLTACSSTAVQAVQLAAGGAALPFYCFPGTFGNGSEYAPLARALSERHAVTAFVCHTLGPDRWRQRSIVELAAEYARFIMARDAGQGCALLGWSFGGDLAYETARQLQGKVAVRFLGVVDVTDRKPNPAVSRDEGEVSWPNRIADWLQQSQMRTHWQQLLHALHAHEQRAVIELLSARTALPCDGPAYDSGEYELWVLLRLEWLRRRYFESNPSKLAVPLHSWVAAATALDETRRARQWQALANLQAEKFIEDATHSSILTHDAFICSVQQVLHEVAGHRG